MATSVGAIEVGVTVDVSQARALGQRISQAFTGAQRSAQEFNSTLAQTENHMKGLSGVALRALTAFTTIAASRALVSFAKESAAAFVDLQRGIIETQTLLGEGGLGDAQFNEFRSGIEQLSRGMAVLSEDAVPALYEAISSGIPESNVFSFLEEARKASIAGVTDLETAAGGLTQVLNAYGVEQADVTEKTQEFSDILFQTVNFGVVRFPELTRYIGNVTPIAAAAGVEFDAIGAALAAMTRQFPNIRRDTTFLRTMLTELTREGSRASDTFERISGTDFESFVSTRGGGAEALLEAMGLLRDEAERTGVNVNNLFQTVEGGMGGLLLAGEGFEELEAAVRSFGSASGSTNRAYEALKNTISFQREELAAELDRLRVDTGEEIAPGLLALERIFVERLAPALSEIAIAFVPVLDRGGVFVNLLEAFVPPLTTVARLLDNDLAGGALQFATTMVLVNKGIAAFKSLNLVQTLTANAAAIRVHNSAVASAQAMLAAAPNAQTFGGATRAQIESVASQATRATGALGAMRGAASSLMGVLSSGTLVTAGLTLGIMAWTNHMADAARKAREEEQRVRSLTDAILNQESVLRLTSDAFEEWIRNESLFNDQNGVTVAQLGRMGFTVEEVGELISGSADQIGNFGELIDRVSFDAITDPDLQDSISGTRDILNELADSGQISGGVLEIAQAFLRMREETGANNNVLPDLARFMDDLARSSDSLTSASNRALDEMVAMGRVAPDTAQAIRFAAREAGGMAAALANADEVMVTFGQGRQIPLDRLLENLGYSAQEGADGITEFVDAEGNALAPTETLASAVGNLAREYDTLFDAVMATSDLDWQRINLDLELQGASLSLDEALKNGFQRLDDTRAVEDLIRATVEQATFNVSQGDDPFGAGATQMFADLAARLVEAGVDADIIGTLTAISEGFAAQFVAARDGFFTAIAEDGIEPGEFTEAFMGAPISEWPRLLASGLADSNFTEEARQVIQNALMGVGPSGPTVDQANILEAALPGLDASSLAGLSTGALSELSDAIALSLENGGAAGLAEIAAAVGAARLPVTMNLEAETTEEVDRLTSVLQQLGLDSVFDVEIRASGTLDATAQRILANEYRGEGARFVNLAKNSEYGRIVTSPMLSWLGEGHKREVVLPLTNPGRTLELFNQAGVADVLSRAGAPVTPPALHTSAPSQHSSGSSAKNISSSTTVEGNTYILNGSDPRALLAELEARERRRLARIIR